MNYFFKVLLDDYPSQVQIISLSLDTNSGRKYNFYSEDNPKICNVFKEKELDEQVTWLIELPDDLEDWCDGDYFSAAIDKKYGKWE